MSPLAPQTANLQAKLNDDSNGNDNTNQLVEPPAEDKIIYTVADLQDMRHARSEEPNSNVPTILARIKKNGELIPPRTQIPYSYSNSFGANIMSSVMNQMKIERQMFGRPADRWEREQNGGRMYNGTLQRPFTRERGFSNGMSNGPTIRLSIKTDVKLREAENAWKPTFLKKDNNDDANELYKQVRSILNKLTAQNFAVLSEQFKSLKIDTFEKLNEVINLVFNKAVNEPNFSVGYAHLSKYLSHCSEEIETADIGRSTFKRTLITKCQIEFERNVANKNATEAALKPLYEKLHMFEKDGDLNGISEIKSQIAEEESNLRRRLVSTVRFIGELYKLDMLTTNIMNVCINTLVHEAAPNHANTAQANEKLECLCKLLTTVGAKLECKPTNGNSISTKLLDLSNYMQQLKRIAENKIRNFKATSRIKFMIMDVIELRNNKWTPKITNEQQQLAV